MHVLPSRRVRLFDEVRRLKNGARCCVLLAACATAFAASDASALYRKARKAEKEGAVAQAFLLYSQAAAADPKKASYRLHAEALAVAAAQQANVKPIATAVGELPPVETVFESWTDRDLAKSRQALPPAELAARAGRQDFDIEGDYRTLFNKVTKSFDLEAIFDVDYTATKRIRFRMVQVDYREALHALEAATHSFAAPLSNKLLMVAEDSEQKRKDLEQVATVSVPVPQALTAQDLTELGTAIKQTVGIEKIAWDAAAGQIVMRDKVSRVLAARSILNDLLAYRTKVEIELEFIEVNETDFLDLGVDIQPSFPLVYLGSWMRSTPTIPTTAGLLSFGGGKTMFAFGAIDAKIIANMNAASTRILLRTSISSVDGQPATFHAGDKYPVLTSGYFGPPSTSTAQAYTPPPSFSFEDLGLVVKVTPHVHEMREMSLDVESEFKVLGTTGLNGIPVISNRKLQSSVRLLDNQWAIVSGVMTNTESREKSGVPMLSRIPVINAFTTRFTRNRQRTYVLMVVKPRLMSTPPSETITHQVFVGSETRAITPL